MKIERARFLMMTTALAAGGAAAAVAACTTKTTETSVDGGTTTPGEDASTDAAKDSAASDAGTDGPAACSDEDGSPGDCTTVTCSDFGKCDSYKQYLKPKLAESAVKCLQTIDGGASCDALDVYGCGNTALALACADPAAKTFCTSFLPKCQDAGATDTQADCEKWVSGLNAAGRTALEACDCAFGVYSCIEGL